MTTINDSKIIEFKKMCDRRGNLSIAESIFDVPYSIERVYWLYDIPGGSMRGGHAHKECLETLIAISGSFDVNIWDGKMKRTFHLDSASKGLFIPTGIWRTLTNFTSGAVCLVLASQKYDEADYIRTQKEFLSFIK